MALLGQLEEFHLAHIIGLLQVEKQTGALALEHDDQRITLYFQDGAIIHAAGEGAGGYDAALVPFQWDNGKFYFEGYELDVEPTITKPNAAIVVAGRLRAAEAHEARALVRSIASVVRLASQVESTGGQIKLNFENWRFLTLVDGRRDLRALAAELGRDEFGIRLLAARLIKERLIELVDPRLSMLRLVALPASMDPHPPDDPMTALMDESALNMLLNGRTGPPQAEVLTADDRSAVVHIEGRPDLSNSLLLSEEVITRLDAERNRLVHLRLIDET
ncbi:MAG: DUF4388 domain-containing protein [Chloroflexia bacterium]